MKTPKNLIRLKKIPYNLALILLTTGASSILGLLSFSGMFALLPALPFAIAALVLSVAYEGEIYLQNIKGALNKLFKYNYLKNQIAREFLLEHFPKDLNDLECPQFFKDYAALQLQLNKQSHHQSRLERKTHRKQIKTQLQDMEKWFALQLLPTPESKQSPLSAYAEDLQTWLTHNHQTSWQNEFNKRRKNSRMVAAFSSCSALFMGLGSTYLIIEAFSATPWIAAIPFTYWPFMIVPMAMVAGAAYGLLTYNTITDLLNNDTINKWFTKVRTHFANEGYSLRNLAMASMSLLLVGLAIALTVCTAGTWWTIATNARPLFDWMRKMPGFIMGVINPIITGLSALCFNIQNTAESLEKLDETIYTDAPKSEHFFDAIKEKWRTLWENENWLQIINPFRIIKILTFTPLRLMLFGGHLLSIALTADRMPGIPQIWAALIAFISEGFEDAHYFIRHTHKHVEDKSSPQEQTGDINVITATLLSKRLGEANEHSHDLDIPAQILQILATPLELLASGWNSLALTLIQGNATEKQLNMPISSAVAETGAQELVPQSKVQLSENWQVEHTAALIEKHIQKHLHQVWFGAEIAHKKTEALRALQQEVRSSKGKNLKELLTSATTNSVFNQHRLFAQKDEKTHTQVFIEELPQRISIAGCA